MPSPKVYLLDAENKVKAYTLTREMTLGAAAARADMLLISPAVDGLQGVFAPAGPGWSYRQTGASPMGVFTGAGCQQISASTGGRLRMGTGMASESSKDTVPLKSGYVLSAGSSFVLYYTFLDKPGTWARLAVPETGRLLLSQKQSNPGASPADPDAAITCRDGRFYLQSLKPGTVKYQANPVSGETGLGEIGVIEVGQQLFFWRQGILHYLNTSSGEIPTTFRINSYGSGMKIRPSVTPAPAPANPVSPAPSAVKGPPSGGIKIVPSGKKVTPSFSPSSMKSAAELPRRSNPSPAIVPAIPKVPETTEERRVRSRAKAIAMAERASKAAGIPGHAAAPVHLSASTPRRFSGRLPGRDILKISIQERSVRNLLHKKVLLKDISLDVHTGEMVLILGGSGAGKTTFMNAVMGYEPANGSISFKGMNVYEEYEKMKYMIGFVPQQDLMRDNDTVYETLKNAGEMKLPASTSPDQLEKRVIEVLGLMGLEAEKTNLVKKLSGGQRKRLSIAQEYIGDPTLFFLDEPDSGLDGGMAKSLMEKLRTIADSQKIVMLISHQPDRTADLFDKVIVLAKSNTEGCGRLAFFGSVDETKRFFGVDALEKVVQKINRRDEGGEGLSDHYIEKFVRGRG